MRRKGVVIESVSAALSVDTGVGGEIESMRSVNIAARTGTTACDADPNSLHVHDESAVYVQGCRYDPGYWDR
ncbi:hypothetical protein A5651_06085 [Mycobacterium sp. 1274761.0]|nr:hypothetical protein A5651_06085 [Mycobacterium sp. 1274761.0]